MSELRLDGKVAIVTGAGRGLGRAYAMLLASRGAAVVVNDLGSDPAGEGQDSTPAQQVVSEIEQAGGRAVANYANVASEQGARSIVDQALECFGSLHIIINNAGNFTDSRPFLRRQRELREPVAGARPGYGQRHSRCVAAHARAALRTHRQYRLAWRLSWARASSNMPR